ncbi:MAG: hypothetical protein ACXAB7_24280 [Candidatus Kariarchaeaceae archaeon]
MSERVDEVAKGYLLSKSDKFNQEMTIGRRDTECSGSIQTAMLILQPATSAD